MAISLERVNLSEITGVAGSSTVDMSKAQEAANGITSSLQQIANDITTNIDGIKQTTQSLLNKAIPKAISSPDENAGIFGNILCGKIPSLNISLPYLNLDFLRDLDFDFDVTICGESKKVNPLDAALSITKVIDENKLFIDSYRENYLKEIITDRTRQILGNLGLPNDSGAISCILGDSTSNIYNTNDLYGNALYDKLNILDQLQRDYCKRKFSDTFLDPIMENDLITKLTHSSLVEKLFNNDDKNNTYSNMYFKNQLSTPYRANVLSASGRMFTTTNNYNNTTKKVKAIKDNYVNPYYNVSTGTVRPTPLLKVNDFEVYEKTDTGTLIYGYGKDTRPIIGFTTEGKPIYGVDNNKNAIIDYTEDNKPIYGYDKVSKLPIIEITPSGDGILESGLVSEGYDKPTIANNKEEIKGDAIIGYLDNNVPFYGYDDLGYPIINTNPITSDYDHSPNTPYGSTYINNKVISPKDLPYLQVDTSIVANSISKMDKESISKTGNSTDVVKDIIASVTVTDKSWNKDDNNEEAYYKLKNEVLKDITVSNVANTDKTFNLTGIYTTKLTTDEKIAVSNLF